MFSSFIHACLCLIPRLAGGLLLLWTGVTPTLAQSPELQLKQAQESASRDSSTWVHFPPRSAQRATSANQREAAAPAVTAPAEHPSQWVQFPFRRIVPPAQDALPLKEKVTTEQGDKRIILTTYADGSTLVETQPLQSTAAATETTAAPAPVAPATVAPTPVIRSFSFTGATVFAPDQLQAWVKSSIGQPLELEKLNDATEKISTAYREAGWIARVSLPDQDVTQGNIEIKITEAKLASTVIEAAENNRTPPELVIAMVAHASPKDVALNVEALDQVNTLINELPGTKAQISLRPGAATGETEAVVKLESTSPLDVVLSTDNAGSRATGESRVIANLQGKSLLERGDLQNLQITTSQGLQAVRWSYSEPLGSTGLRGGIYLSNARYHLVLPEFSAINARGPSTVRGLELNYPWLRHPMGSLNLQASLEQKHFHNEAADVVTSRYKSDLLNLGLSGQMRDELGGGGLSTVTVQSTSGRLDLTGSANQVSDAQTFQTNGSFRKLRLQVMRQQKLIDQDVLQLSAQGQWASKNLDGSEKFFLGGPQGVRAYPVNEAGGSEGKLFSVEWQHPFLGTDQQRYTLSAFADKGQIRQNKFNTYAGAATLNDYGLRGYGLWLGTQIPWSLGETQLRLTWSRRLGSNPNGFTPLQDQDGSQMIQRLWFFANHLF